MLYNRNLYDPILYMIKQLMKKHVLGGGVGETGEDYMDRLSILDLIREKGRLKKVIGKEGFEIELFYTTKGQLDKVIGRSFRPEFSDDPVTGDPIITYTTEVIYTLETQLVYDKGILVRVIPVETVIDPPEPPPLPDPTDMPDAEPPDYGIDPGGGNLDSPIILD